MARVLAAIDRSKLRPVTQEDLNAITSRVRVNTGGKK
jgi:hypothetical protein